MAFSDVSGSIDTNSYSAQLCNSLQCSVQKLFLRFTLVDYIILAGVIMLVAAFILYKTRRKQNEKENTSNTGSNIASGNGSNTGLQTAK